MYITFEALLNLPDMRKAQVIAGQDGLCRPIRSAHAADQPGFWEWTNTGELIFVTGSSLGAVEEELLKICTEINQRDCAGIVLFIGAYIKEVPASVRNLCDKITLPVVTLPQQLHVNTVIFHVYQEIFRNYDPHRSINDLLKELLCFDYTKTYEDKLIYYGYNPKLSHIAANIQIENLDNYEPIQNSNRYKEVETIVFYLSNMVRYLFERKRINCLYMTEEQGLILLAELKTDTNWEDKLLPILRGCQEHFAYDYPGLTISIGTSSPFQTLAEFKHGVQEANQAFSVLRALQKTNDIMLYQKIGIYRLFFRHDRQELLILLQNTLGVLLEYDSEFEGSLLDTLEAFLACDRHIGNTANRLFVHRNTLKYRINRINEIMNCDLSDANTCFDISLALKIRHFLKLSP